MAKHKRLLWRLFPSYLLITLISVAAVTWYAFGSLQAFYFDELVHQLETRATLIREQIIRRLPIDKPENLVAIGKQFDASKSNGFGVSIALPSKETVEFQEADQPVRQSESRPPEIAEALAGRFGKATRPDYPSGGRNHARGYTRKPGWKNHSRASGFDAAPAGSG